MLKFSFLSYTVFSDYKLTNILLYTVYSPIKLTMRFHVWDRSYTVYALAVDLDEKKIKLYKWYNVDLVPSQ